MKTISVAIPVRIVEPEQHESLLKCLHSVFAQTLRPLDVTISIDGDSEDLIKSLRNEFEAETFQIVVNPNKPGISTNSNNALSYCKGDLVHVLHQDDELISQHCYDMVLEKFEIEDFKWLILEGTTKSGNEIKPIFNSYTKFGINRMGGPSGLIVPRNLYIPFNTAFSMMTDVVNFELYFRNYGYPSVMLKPWILYGDLKSSASRCIARHVVIEELQMVMDKFNVSHEEIRSFVADSHLDLDYRKLVFDSAGSSIIGSQRLSFQVSYIVKRFLRKFQSVAGNKAAIIFREYVR
jgi:glycosyltransferase involved in cell wall biosynthesis